MYHIIFDLELNTAFKAGEKPGDLINSHCPNEIIEIGAVKINDNMEVVDTFESLIKPTFYKKLSPIVVKKTGITYKNVYSSQRFKTILQNFRNWIGNEEFMLYSWGSGDILDFKRNCNCHHLNTDWLENFVDLQREFRTAYDLDMKINYGLKTALEYLNIVPDKKLHRALVDAEYTAKIFIKIKNKSNQ